MSVTRKWLTVAALSAAAVVAGGGVAYAGTPSPTPTHTHTPPPTPTPTPTQPVVPVAVPWQFDLQQSNIGNVSVNNVESDSPGGILMNNWRDDQLTPNVDRFSRGGNSVTLLHDGLAGGTIDVNRYTCTAVVSQTGAFRIIAGTGTGAGFRSRNGQFDLEALFSWDLLRKHSRAQVCPLSFLSDGRILRILASNSQSGLPQPTFVDVAVQGRADLVRTRPVIRPFAPTASPVSS